jgi:hypothetical protein
MLKTDLTGTLKAGDLAVSGKKPRFQVRNLLVIGQVTVSTVLLVAAGLLVKDFVKTLDYNPRFRTDHILLMALDPAVAHYNEQQTRNFYKQLIGHVKALPGVRSVALGQNLPLGISHSSRTVAIEGFEMHNEPVNIPPLPGSILAQERACRAVSCSRNNRARSMSPGLVIS